MLRHNFNNHSGFATYTDASIFPSLFSLLEIHPTYRNILHPISQSFCNKIYIKFICYGPFLLGFLPVGKLLRCVDIISMLQLMLLAMQQTIVEHKMSTYIILKWQIRTSFTVYFDYSMLMWVGLQTNVGKS